MITGGFMAQLILICVDLTKSEGVACTGFQQKKKRTCMQFCGALREIVSLVFFAYEKQSL
jgi:hypothetical protein